MTRNLPLLLAFLALACTERPDDPPVLHLPFDGSLAVSGTAADGVVAEAHGDAVGFVPGAVGQALFVGGSADWVDVPLPDLPFFERGATLELRVRRDDWTNPYRGGSASQSIAHFDPLVVELSRAGGDEDRISGDLREPHLGRRLRSRVRLEPGVWVHISLVYNPSPGITVLYVDGERVQSALGRAEPTRERGNLLRVGTWFERNQAFRGAIDELKVYDYPRRARDVREDARRNG